MSEERKKVLQMLAEGKITVEESERLLAKLALSDEEEQPPAASGAWESGGGDDAMRPAGASGAVAPRAGTAMPKYLRVLVDSHDGDKVNIRVPLALVRTGIKLSTMLPQDASQKLHEKGVDLSQLNGLEGDELLEALRELAVDVDSADGDTVRIFCE